MLALAGQFGSLLVIGTCLAAVFLPVRYHTVASRMFAFIRRGHESSFLLEHAFAPLKALLCGEYALRSERAGTLRYAQSSTSWPLLSVPFWPSSVDAHQPGFCLLHLQSFTWHLKALRNRIHPCQAVPLRPKRQC